MLVVHFLCFLLFFTIGADAMEREVCSEERVYSPMTQTEFESRCTEIIEVRTRILSEEHSFSIMMLTADVHRYINQFFIEHVGDGIITGPALKQLTVETGILIRDGCEKIMAKDQSVPTVRGCVSSAWPVRVRCLTPTACCSVLRSSACLVLDGAGDDVSQLPSPSELASSGSSSGSSGESIDDAFVEFFGLVETLGTEYFLTPAQRTHFILAGREVSKDFLPYLRAELFAALDHNFFAIAHVVTHEARIAYNYNPLGVFRQAVSFYRKNSSFSSTENWPDLTQVKFDNLESATRCFYRAMSSGDFSSISHIEPSVIRGVFVAKECKLPANYPFKVDRFVDSDFVVAIINRMAAHHFLSDRQVYRLMEKIGTSSDPRMYYLVAAETFRQSARTCKGLSGADELVDSLAQDLDDAVVVHFNDRSMYQELNGRLWQTRIAAAKDCPEALAAIEEELYALVMSISNRK